MIGIEKEGFPVDGMDKGLEKLAKAFEERVNEARNIVMNWESKKSKENE